MTEAGFSATVTISANDDGSTRVSLDANYPVAVSVYERVSEPGGERVTTAEFVSPDVTETTHFIEGGDDGEGDELDFGEGVEPDADDDDDDLPIAAEGGIHVLPR